MRPVVSIILVVYNGRPYLEACLDSLQWTLPAGAEVIVVDNGSTDGSAALVRERMPEACLLINKTNRGFAAACNQAAQAAQGEILVFLNQDTRAEPGWLEALLEPFQDPAVGLTTPTILWMDDPERIQSCGQDVHYTGLVFARNFGVARAALADTSPTDVAAVSGATFAVRRAVWEDLGGFCGTFYMYYEETDLSWRARRAGYRCLHVPDSVVCHAGRLDQPSSLALYYSFRNRWLMIWRNWGAQALLLLAPGLVLADLMEWGLALARGWPGIAAKARALGWSLTHPRALLRLRAESRQGSGMGDRAMLATLGWRLSPRVITGGPVSRQLMPLCQALFYLNWRGALKILRADVPGASTGEDMS
ncbi:MAG: glycosyltransferase family 2 protein [Thermoflexales bacterium]|nr:glycosyltransferase family 2 protein [Thermoflexales bacterium]